MATSEDQASTTQEGPGKNPGPFLKGFENVDIARSFMWVDSTEAPDSPRAMDESAAASASSMASSSASLTSSAMSDPGEDPVVGQESVVGTPEEDSLITKIQHNAAWLSTFVSQLSTWLATTSLMQTTDAEPSPEEAVAGLFPEEEHPDEIWQEWEWIMSETEKLALRRTNADSASIKKELEALRSTANVLKARPIFLQHAKALLREKLSPDDVTKLAETVLDSSKRSKVVADVVTAHAPEWLQFIQDRFFKEEDSAAETAYRESYSESTYSKGVVGGLKETGWQASHGPGHSGLTHQVLGDITWAFWKTVNSSLRWSLNRELSAEESASLAEKIAACQDKLIELWLETINNSEFGVAHEGRLPAIWAEEAEKEKERLIEIKRAGANARYEHKPVIISSTHRNRKKLGELRQFLETHLQFRSTA